MEVTTFFLGICIAYALFLLIRWFLERYEIEDLKNKAVFITGCDSGFGKALAIRCAERGMPVLAGCLLEKSISEYKELSKSYRTPIDAFLLDVTSDKSVIDAKNYVENRTQKYGGLHGVVNNAGILGHTFFDDFLTLEDYKKVAEVNTWGVIRVTQAMKSLVKKTKGRIVTVTSACSRVGVMSIGPYTTSKFAISGYCDVIRNELRMFGVSLHILEPGFFNTYLTSTENVEKQLNSLYAKCSEEAKNEYGKEFFIKMRTKTAWVLSLIGSNNIDYVTDAYFHALTAVYPRTRYQVGWDSILIYAPLSFLPTPLVDFLTQITCWMIRVPTPIALTKEKQP